MKLLKFLPSALHIVVLVVFTAAWPVSFFRHWPLAVSLENTPAFGWVVGTNLYTFFSGWCMGLDGGYFAAFRFLPAPNPKPLVPSTGVTVYDADLSHWVGVSNYPCGVGTILDGRPHEALWTARTGTIFPFWPVSLVTCILLLRLMNRLRRQFRRPTGLCPSCSYDLRAHHPGEKCPECGRVIPEPKPT